MTEKIQAIKVSLNQALNDREKPWKSAFDLAEAKTGVPRAYIFLGKFQCGRKKRVEWLCIKKNILNGQKKLVSFHLT